MFEYGCFGAHSVGPEVFFIFYFSLEGTDA
jgi:hypothetical protein